MFGSRTISEPRSAFNYRALLVNAIIGLRCPVYLLVLARVLFHSFLEFLRSNRGRRNSNDRIFGKIFPNNNRDPYPAIQIRRIGGKARIPRFVVKQCIAKSERNGSAMEKRVVTVRGPMEIKRRLKFMACQPGYNSIS